MNDRPPDRRAEEHDVRGLDLHHEVRPIILCRFTKAEPDRQRRVREAHHVDVDCGECAHLVEYEGGEFPGV